MKKEEKKPIAPTLKVLDKYKTVYFPLARVTSVRSTIQQLVTESDKAFTTKKNKDTQMIEVTRTA